MNIGTSSRLVPDILFTLGCPLTRFQSGFPLLAHQHNHRSTFLAIIYKMTKSKKRPFSGFQNGAARPGLPPDGHPVSTAFRQLRVSTPPLSTQVPQDTP